MSAARVYPVVFTLFVTLLLGACDESDSNPCCVDRIDPPLSDLAVTWEAGTISANLMPIGPPDPVTCVASLILENRSHQTAFSKLEVPTADVILAKTNSTLGTIPLETTWDGILVPGERDTVMFIKNTGDGTSFHPPCGELVLLEFLIRNADEETRVFRADTLGFACVFIASP